MLKQILIPIVVVLIALFLFLFAIGSFKETSKQLMQAVYIDKDYAKYKQLLSKLSTKLFLSKKQRLLMDLSIYDSMDDDEKWKVTLKQINQYSYGLHDTLNIKYMQMKFYIKHHDLIESKKVFESLEEFRNNEDAYIKGIIKEFEYIYYVDGLRDTSYLDEMIRLANNVDVPYSKALFFLRASLLQHKLHNDKESKSNLNKVHDLLTKRVFDEVIHSVGCEDVVKQIKDN